MSRQKGTERQASWNTGGDGCCLRKVKTKKEEEGRRRKKKNERLKRGDGRMEMGEGRGQQANKQTSKWQTGAKEGAVVATVAPEWTRTARERAFGGNSRRVIKQAGVDEQVTEEKEEERGAGSRDRNGREWQARELEGSNEIGIPAKMGPC